VVWTEGRTPPAPWRLRCTWKGASEFALLDRLPAHHRTRILFDVAMMVVAGGLGAFAVHQARRREALEALFREQARVRELERQLFHAERLSTVGRLAAGIAHEINNPLEGMANYLRLAREELDRGEASSAGERFDGVEQGLQRAAAIIRRVLDHASPSSAPGQGTAFDLGEVLTQSLDFVRSRKEFAAIRFEIELNGRPLHVRGSPVALGQAFLNLLLNACEAQPRGGEGVVRAHGEAGRVAVEIADRGPGVPAADRARVFERFYSTKRSSGLGLSICHTLVQQNQGEISVEDRPGGGAIFRVTLPAR
jgi:signal transduction histidine kinase